MLLATARNPASTTTGRIGLRRLGACAAVCLFALLAPGPVSASAEGPSLQVAGEPLEVGAPLELLSEDLVIKNKLETHLCKGSKLGGEVTENPGAAGTMTWFTIPPGGECTGGTKVIYKIAAESPLIFSAGGQFEIAGFTMVESRFAGSGSLCKYEADLQAEFEFEQPVEFSLSGELILIKSAGEFCFPTQQFVGNFTLSSEGQAVEVF